MRFILPLLLAIALGGCASGERQIANSDIATTVDIASMLGAAETDDSYLIGPIDKLRIRVFQVPDLSFEDIQVDASGNLQMPLIGSVPAAGRTPAQLSVDLQTLLAQRYLRNPQVSVSVAEAASQKLTVDGAVIKPGVYTMRGRTTLLQAVAMADGPTKTAALDSVVVFRQAGDRRMVAVFDLAAIRGGQAVDPVLSGDDIVVVDGSRLKAVLRDVVAALPGLAVFTYF